MKLTDLKPAKGSRKNKKRKGRGSASGHGDTCCRGNDGQGQRSGSEVRAGFEGGQMPLFRRLPKKKYFHVVNRKNYAVVNVADLAAFEGQDINLQLLKEKGLVRKNTEALRVLGRGELSVKVNVSAYHASESAKEKIEKAGGTLTILKK